MLLHDAPEANSFEGGQPGFRASSASGLMIVNLPSEKNAMKTLGIVGEMKSGNGRCHYMMESPPSTISAAPVMNDASSLASHRIGQAISSGDAQRPSKEVSLRSVFSVST